MLPGGWGQHLGKSPWNVPVRCTSFALAAFPLPAFMLAQEESLSLSAPWYLGWPHLGQQLKQVRGMGWDCRTMTHFSLLCAAEGTKGETQKKGPTAK